MKIPDLQYKSGILVFLNFDLFLTLGLKVGL